MKTAVEWLKSELTEVERNLINKTFLQLNNTLAGHRLKDIFEQAKEMEKQQIIDAFDEGKSDGYKTAREWDEMILWSTAEQYYNQTFKKD
jgi:hypothetical protein